MKKQSTQEIVLIAALIAAAVAYRVISGEMSSTSNWLPNFSPMAALVLCGAVFLPVGLGLLLPMAILLISDLILNLHFGAPMVEASMVVRYVVLGALAGAGLWLRGHPKPVQMLMSSLAGSIAFYITTNTASWFTLGEYSKTFAGWVQALTTGLPGYAPTWVFFRNSIVSDLLFTMLIILSVSAAKEKATETRAFAVS